MNTLALFICHQYQLKTKSNQFYNLRKCTNLMSKCFFTCIFFNVCIHHTDSNGNISLPIRFKKTYLYWAESSVALNFFVDPLARPLPAWNSSSVIYIALPSALNSLCASMTFWPLALNWDWSSMTKLSSSLIISPSSMMCSSSNGYNENSEIQIHKKLTSSTAIKKKK